MKKLMGVCLMFVMILQMTVFPVFVRADETAAEPGEETSLTLDIPVFADAMVQMNTGDNNFGITNPIFNAANQGVQNREIFLKFDLSDILNMGFAVTKAELSVTYGDQKGKLTQSGREFAIYRVTDSFGDTWTEGAANNAKTGIKTDLTWNNSRSMAETKELLHDSKKDAVTGNNLKEDGRPLEDDPTVCDITAGVKAELQDKSKFLTLNILTTYLGTESQTWGFTIYSKEANVDDALKPHLILTLDESEADKLAVYRDAAAINLSGNESVNKDFILPATGKNGTTISWESSNTDVLSIEDGTAKYHAPTGITEVTLTATITKGAVSKAQTYVIQVLPSGLQDTDLDLETITVAYEEPSLTMALPTSGQRGSIISWSSDDTSIIDTAAISKGSVKVNRPALVNKTVQLTATATKADNENATKTFGVEIPALGRLVSDKDTYINISTDGSKNVTALGKETTMTTSDANVMRKLLIGFDLSVIPVEKTVKTATLYVTKSDKNINYMNLYYMQDNKWDESSLTGQNYNEVLSHGQGEKVAEARLGGSGNNKKYSVDLTAAVQKALSTKDKYLTLEGIKFTGIAAGEAGALSKYPTTLYTREYEITDYSTTNDFRPYLVFEYTEDATEITLVKQLNGVSLPSVITDSLDLPKTTADGTAITWTDGTTNKQDCITIGTDGTATVTPQTTETTVKLKASVSKDGKTISKYCFVTMQNPAYDYVLLDTYFNDSEGRVVDSVSAGGSSSGVRVLRTGNKAGKLFFAVYQDERLVDCKVVEVPSGTNVGQYFTVPIKGIAFGESVTGYTYKAMLMSADENLVPLAIAH